MSDATHQRDLGRGFVARHTRSILAVLLALAVAGALSAAVLPMRLFPQVAFPRILIDVNAGARPAQQTALLVTIPLEHAVRGVPGVRTMRSTTSRGSVQIALDFPWGTNMVATATEVNAAVAQPERSSRRCR